tara:strand:- start:133 stop:594 length:462 start_codon:yes stop_codon:yes gene_type:complete
MSAFWGTPTWIFLHTFAEKINESFFINNKVKVLKMIKMICSLLPCPVCRRDANEFMKKVNLSNFKNKRDLKMMLFFFHNTVNVRLGKPNFLLAQYNYKEKSLEETFKRFKETFSKKYDSGITKAVTERMMEKSRISFTEALKKWLDINKHFFN